MTEVIPAIIGQDFPSVLEKIARVEGLVNWAQLDVMDGIFTPEYSWNRPADLESVPGKLKLEAHLMVSAPEELVEEWLPFCDRIIFHLEATTEPLQVIDVIKKAGIAAGVALLLHTPLDKVDAILPHVDVVQLMSIATIGHHGEPLDERVYERISALRQKSKTVKINVDGGVNLENAKKLLDAGADNLVVGSAIWQASDLPGAIDALRRTN